MNKYFKGYITRENAVKVMCRETCHPGVFCPDTYCVEMWDKFKDIPNEDVRPAPDRERIDEYLAHIKANQSVHASVESVVAMNYWIGKLYEEIYGNRERPRWMV